MIRRFVVPVFSSEWKTRRGKKMHEPAATATSVPSSQWSRPSPSST
jgi:hypothetical protein